MTVLGIDYTFFAVSDMQKSLTFYRDLLRIPLARLILEETWAEFEIDPGTLVLGHGDSFTHPGGGMVALAVDDAEAAMQELEQAGVSVSWALEELPCVIWRSSKILTAIVSLYTNGRIEPLVEGLRRS